ncbi:hypothetical protein RP29_00310 [Acidovorax temperans]|uniref:Uncharacterized protein n=1 Tax=Acidovorax temperans TaxID=80878 RepID=A0A0D7KD86_9BURK|nr:hypothetical protein [Acidovorax temperans]KJA12346.1 hypothetical protein RP29_00310 [Acidovorax temperans]
MLPFIYQRFFDYRMEKQSHGQWDEDAKGLSRTVREADHDLAKFINLVRIDPNSSVQPYATFSPNLARALRTYPVPTFPDR